MRLTCPCVQVENNDFFASRPCYAVAVGTWGVIVSKSNMEQESDSLVDGTSEVLERKGIDVGAGAVTSWLCAILKVG